jgi:pantoate kinase
MVWDLGKAMRKKEEFESARLMDFEFRQRVRAARLFARSFGLDEDRLVQEVAVRSDDGVIELLARETGNSVDAVSAELQKSLDEARKQLVAERGDPTPYRLG